MNSKTFVKIPVDILDALCRLNLTSYEARIFFYVLRKTYGWHKENFYLVKKRIAHDIGIDKSSLRRSLNTLCARKILEIVIDVDGKTKIGIQSLPHLWLDKVPLQRTLDFAAEPATKYKEGVK